MKRLAIIKNTIVNLKHLDDFQAIPRIPVLSHEQVVAFLRPVPSELKGLASDDSRLMAEWRNLHKSAFFTWITPTEKSTGEWLTDVYALDSLNIIFMIETPEGTPFGHIALYNFQREGSVCEFGRVIRGQNIGHNGGMTLGSIALLQWAHRQLKTERFFLEVFKNNKKAISLYERIGFRIAEMIPLRREDNKRITTWEKITSQAGNEMGADGYALRMEMDAEQLYGDKKSLALTQ